MSRPLTKNQWADLWIEEFVNEVGLCCLCGNHGFIDTRGKVKSPAGTPAGALRYCICPNGRKIKKLGIPLPLEVDHSSIFDDPTDVEGMPTYPGLTVEPYMRSAGAEISRYAFEMEKLGFPRLDVLRMVEIGAWCSIGKSSDYEMALVKVAGGVVGVMRRAGFDFKEDEPIVAQWEAFIETLPK